MESYAENWFKLIFGSNPGLERYWITVTLFAAVCFLVGIASLRLRMAAAVATTVVFVAYVVALVPLMVWASSCPGCRVGEHESARSVLLYSQHAFLGGFFAMGIAALWIGVLLSQGTQALLSWQRSGGHPAAQGGQPPAPTGDRGS